MPWLRVTKFDRRAVALADEHYSRRKPGSSQFMPPGQTIVLLHSSGRAVFGWCRPDPKSGVKQMNGLDGWTCTIFRNDGGGLSSGLILEAEESLYEHADDCGPDGLLTYVWDEKVSSANPGYCFKCAGWIVHPDPEKRRSADDKKTLLWKAWSGPMRSRQTSLFDLFEAHSRVA